MKKANTFKQKATLVCMSGNHFYAEFQKELSLTETEKFLKRVAVVFKATIDYHLSAQEEITPYGSRNSNHEIFGQVKSDSEVAHFCMNRSERGQGFIGIGFGVREDEHNASLADRITNFAILYNSEDY
jgi:hypothetical protein